MNHDLYLGITKNSNALKIIDHSALYLRRAFRLPDFNVHIVSRSKDLEESISKHNVLDDVAIAGFGDMAISLISEIVPRTQQSLGGGLSMRLPSPRGLDTMVLLQKAEFEQSSDWGKPGNRIPLEEGSKFVLIVFQIGSKFPDLMKQAIAFAQNNKSDNRVMVAVLPHLIQEFARSEELMDIVIPSLRANFDAVWMLSDRSPYTRQALPFGPARSVAAAGNHLRYLLNLARDKEFRNVILGAKKSGANINVIGSAIGARPILKLAEHALLRLAHNLYELDQVSSIYFATGFITRATNDRILEMTNRLTSNEFVKIINHNKIYVSKDHVFAIIKDIKIVEDNSDNFRRYCLDRFLKFDWKLDFDKAGEAIIISNMKFPEIHVRFKYVRYSRFSTRSKMDNKSGGKDGIVITNATISSRAFAEYVLNGQTPIHHSRIDVVDRIYKRRYLYAISYLKKGKDVGKRIATLAVIKWFLVNRKDEIERDHGAILQLGANITLVFRLQSVEFNIPFELSMKSTSNSVRKSGRSKVNLSDRGWELLETRIDE